MFIKLQSNRNIQNSNINLFILSILDKFKGNVWLAGGSVRSLIDKSEIQDYDLYFRNLYTLTVVNAYIQKFLKIKFQCPIGELTTYSGPGINIQCISNGFFANPIDVIDSFDFTICQMITDGVDIWTSLDVIRDIRTKQLNLWKLTYPAATIKRISKYVNRGYKPKQSLFTEIVERIDIKDKSIIDIDRVYVD